MNSKSIELPNGIYKISKVKATNKNSTYVSVGSSYSGEYSPTVITGQSFFSHGYSYRDTLTTSIVEDFKLLKDNKVEIHTLNSVYLLEEIFLTNPE